MAEQNVEIDSSFALSPVKKKIKNKDDQTFELTWPKDDMKKLIGRIEEHIPRDDTLHFQRRAEKLPWDEIQFDEHTPKECHQMWTLMQQRVRGFRILPEIIEDAKNWINKPWTNFYKKSSKNHPAMPKKPLTPYILFYKKVVSTVMEENPGIHTTELPKIIGQMYKNLPEKKKLKLKNKAEIMKADYDKKLKEFYELYPEEVKLVKRMKPKRITAFNAFLQDFIKNKSTQIQTKGSLQSISKEVRQKWNELSDNDKLVWIEKAKTTAELNFAATSENLDILPDILVLSKKERKILEKARNKKDNVPKKPPTSLYVFYVQQVFKDKPSGNSAGLMKKIGEDWKKMSSEEKAELKIKYDELMNNYKSECAYYSKLTDLPQGTDKKKRNSKKNKSDGDDVVDNKPSNSKDSKAKKEKPKKRKVEDNSNSTEETSKKIKINGIDESPAELIEQILQNEPKEPPQDILKYYSKTMKKKMKIRFNSQEELSEAWDNLEKGEKKAIKKEYKALKEQYVLNYQEFLDTLSPKQLKKYMEYKNMQEN